MTIRPSHHSGLAAFRLLGCLFVAFTIFAPTVQSIYQGCVISGCGQPCPSGLVAHTPIRRANRSNACISSGLEPGQLCCPFVNSGGQWVPNAPYNTPDHHTCATSDPCPALGKTSVFDDQWGDVAAILCFTGTYWYCENPPPKENPGIGNFQSLGCYTDSDGSRGLSEASYDWSGMTVAKCLDIAKNYKYAGVEYYGECRYGNTLSSSSTKASSGCNTPCAGNGAEICGGSDRMTLYQNQAYQPPALENVGVGNFQSMGCYTDSSSFRGLSEMTTDWSGMTVAKCVEIAKEYKYAGVEFYGECHYGNILASSSVKSTGCNTPCAGNQAELCGGSGRMNMYNNIAYKPPATQNPGVGTFKALGCYTDSSTSRTLSNVFTDWEGMTVAKCVAKAAEYKYAGVEYYGECRYGNSIGSSSTASTGCNTPCAGNQSELCGGGDRLTLYENTAYQAPPAATTVPSVGDWTSRGCYVDSTTSRSLTGGSASDSSMTVAKCIGLAKGWKYVGVENSNECYWGDVLTASTTSGCSSACSGAATQICGGSGKLSIYENTVWQDLNRIQLAKKLEEFYQLCIDITADINEWLNSLKSSQTKRRRDGWLSKLTNRKTGYVSVTETIDSLFETARHRGTINDEERRSFESTSSAISNVLDDSINSFVYPPAQQLSIAQAGSTILGIPASTVGYGGLGIFGFLGVLIYALNPFSGGGQVTLTTTTCATLAATSTTKIMTNTTSTCSSTSTPTKLVVLTTEDSTRRQYDNLIISLKLKKVIILTERIYDDVSIRFFEALFDECQRELVLEDPIISTVSRTALGRADDEVSSSSKSKRNISKKSLRRGQLPEASPSSENRTHDQSAQQGSTNGLLERDIGAGINLRMQPKGEEFQPLHNHLRWLSVPGAKRTLTGRFYDFRDYMYEDTSNTATHDRIQVFVLDTGIAVENGQYHQELQSNIGTPFNAITRKEGTEEAADTDGHGTCMASHVGGTISGVYKNALIIPVKMLEGGGFPPYITDVMDALSYVRLKANTQIGAVLSMSFGFLPADLQVYQGQTNFDPFPDLLSRLQRRGMITVCSTGNHADSDDDYQYLDAATPRKHGNTGSALIVVGNAKFDGSRNDYSCHTYRGLDTGILSLYSMGTLVLCANGPVNQWTRSSGSSQATAQVAGMAAYFLSKRTSVVQHRNGAQNSIMMKDFLRNLAIQKKGNWPDTIPRAALDHEMSCASLPSTGQATIEVDQGEESRISMSLDEYPTIVAISNGMQVLLGANSLPQCKQFPAV